MNKFLAIFGLFLVFCLFAQLQEVVANEGRVIMKNGPVACEGLSIWQNDRYSLFGRCNGLVYPYAETLDHYTLWVQPDGKSDPIKLDDVNVGIFEGKLKDRYRRVFITAEENGTEGEPSANVIVSADLQPLDFQEAPVVPVVFDSFISPTPAESIVPAVESAQPFNIGTMLSGRPLIILIIAVVVVLVILALVWR